VARDEAMHRLLQQWAQWMTVGDGSGYPTMSVLHTDWSPPSPGQTPTMKTSAPNSARRTNRLMAGWSERLRATVMLHYGFPGLSVADQAQRLGCARDTVYQRVELAQQLLRRALAGAQPEFRHNDTLV
jgi:DNA-directed RNA polymerase specialized sigma24 family protein